MAKVTRRHRQRIVERGGLLFLVLWLLIGPARGVGQVRPRRILLLNAFHVGLSWTDGIVSGIESVLEPSGANIQLYIEYMDVLRFANTDYRQLWYDILSEKYRYLAPDVIIVSDDEAFQFMLDYREELFPDVPVVFCAVNAFEEEMLVGHRHLMTGVVERINLDDTLELALTLHPQAKRAVVINDTTNFGRIAYPHYLDIREKYGDAVNFRYHEDPDLEFLLGELRGATAEDTIILLVSLSRDRANRFYSYEEAARLLVENTNAPIYGLSDAYLGYGLVGGRLASGRAQGEVAAQMAVRILNGELPASIPVARDLANRFMLDYEQVQRFGIEQSQLPGYNPKWADEFPIIISAPPTFIEQYGLTLMVATVAVLVGAVIFGVQYNSLRRVRETEAEVRQSNLELEAIRASLEQRVESRTRDLAKRSEQLELASAVTRDIAAIHDLDELLRSIVNLISERFGFYHAGVFLTDRTGDLAVLTAASSAGGQKMLVRRHTLRRGRGLVGTTLATGEPRIALDVGDDAVWFDNPDLPETRSELTLPLSTRGQVIGVLDVQSVEPEAFVEEDVRILRTMADQLAVAIDNARLFAEAQEALEAERRAYGELEREAWQQLFRVRPDWGYISDEFGVASLDQHVEARAEDAESLPTLALPVKTRDHVLGVFQARKPDGEAWSPAEQELLTALLDQVGVALEGARLYRDTQRREARERAIREISDRMQQAVDMESLARITAEEVRRLLGGSRVFVRLSEQAETQSPASAGEARGGDEGHGR